MKLDITSLKRAASQLKVGLEQYQQDISDDQIRDGLIQRFEFTYELSHKMLKRYLEMASANPQQLDEMTFQAMIRTGSEQGLLKHGWPEWRTYREMRGKTSHTYDEVIAKQVVMVIPAFLEEAQFLISTLDERIANNG